MPRVNIYIRKEDEKKWAGIADKPEFIHNALNSKRSVSGDWEPKNPGSVSLPPNKTPKEESFKTYFKK